MKKDRNMKERKVGRGERQKYEIKKGRKIEI